MTNKNIEMYIKKLNEDISVPVLIVSVFLKYFYELITVIQKGINSIKVDEKLTEKLNKITGKNYEVRVIRNKIAWRCFCFGKYSTQIYITTGFLNNLTDREVMSILLHEVNHMKSFKSIIIKLTTFSSKNFILFKFLEAITENIRNGFNKRLLNLYVIVLLLYIAIYIPSFMFSRKEEYESDEYVIRFGYGKDLISAFEKMKKRQIVKDEKRTNLEKILKMINDLERTHPTLENRINNLIKKTELYEAIIENNDSKIKKVIGI